MKRMKVDFVISAGRACCSAYHLRRLRMRKFSSPCDWMDCYSLDVFLDVLRTEGTQMFRHARIDKNNKCVVDESNGMVSMHDFKCNEVLEVQLPCFYEKMHRRALNTITAIRNARSVGIVMYREIPDAALLSFAESVKELFPNTQFYIVNILDVPSSHGCNIRTVYKLDNYIVIEVVFDDAHENGRSRFENPHFWKGNEYMWSDVLERMFDVKGRKRKLFIERIRGMIWRTRVRVHAFFNHMK